MGIKQKKRLDIIEEDKEKGNDKKRHCKSDIRKN